MVFPKSRSFGNTVKKINLNNRILTKNRPKMKEMTVESPRLGQLISEIIEREQLVRRLHEEGHMGHATIAKLKGGT